MLTRACHIWQWIHVRMNKNDKIFIMIFCVDIWEMQCGSSFECYNLFYGNDNTPCVEALLSPLPSSLLSSSVATRLTNEIHFFFFFFFVLVFAFSTTAHNHQEFVFKVKENRLYSVQWREAVIVYDTRWFFFSFFWYWMSVISKWHTPNSNNFRPTINLIIHSYLFNARPIAERNVWHGHWMKTMEEYEGDEWEGMKQGKTNGMK